MLDTALPILRDALAERRGLILVLGLNDARLEASLVALAGALARLPGRRVSGVVEVIAPDALPFSEAAVVDAARGEFFGGLIARLRPRLADALLVEELRDRETAEHLVELAQEHLVISSVRGMEVVAAFERLLELSIAWPAIISTLRLILLQRNVDDRALKLDALALGEPQRALLREPPESADALRSHIDRLGSQPLPTLPLRGD